LKYKEFSDFFEKNAFSAESEAKDILGEIAKKLTTSPPDTYNFICKAVAFVGSNAQVKKSAGENFRLGRGNKEIFKIVNYYLEWHRPEMHKLIKSPDIQIEVQKLLNDVGRLLFKGETFSESVQRPVRELSKSAKIQDAESLVPDNELNAFCEAPTNLHSANTKPQNRVEKICYLAKPSISKSNSNQNCIDFRFQL